MADIGVSDPCRDLTHRQVGFFQQCSRVIEPDLLNIFGKAHPGIILDQADQMPFAVMEKFRHFLQAGVLVIVLHIFQKEHKIRLIIFPGRVRDKDILLMIAQQKGKEQLCNLIFHRIFISLIGAFLKVEIFQDLEEAFVISGMDKR